MAMLRPNIAYVYLLVVLNGCASPLSNSWDDLLYAKFMQEYSASDTGAQLQGSAQSDSPTQAPVLAQLDSLNLENAIAIGLNNHPRLRAAAYDIRAFDIDADGDLDLLIAGQASSNVVWYENPMK